MGILKTINGISVYLFYISFTIIFYISLKKCFLREGESKVKLFFWSLLTNPFVVFLLAVIISLIVIVIYTVCNGNASGLGNNDTDSAFWRNELLYSNVAVFIASILFTFLMILFSYLMGKALKAYNKSLVMFVYLTFSVISCMYDDRSSFASENDNALSGILFDVNNILYLIVVWVVYFFIIRALSELSDRKRRINSRLFIVPPTAFMIGYASLDFGIYISFSKDANSVFQLLSLMILVLFIWAFHIIIRNIKATDDALEAKDEVRVLSVEIMEALANTIDAKDKYTNGHSLRVAQYSRMIAEKMGLSAEMCENIYYMGLLHDIGKIGVPNEIINKPSKLTDSEYDIIKTHPVTGYNILSKIESRPNLALGARWHHERYDGKGYPDGKAGEEICLEARIIAVADSYDAMTSNRSYRKYMPRDVVRGEIEKNIGTQFDPEAARCMLQIIDEDKEYTLHEVAENKGDLNLQSDTVQGAEG